MTAVSSNEEVYWEDRVQICQVETAAWELDRGCKIKIPGLPATA